MMKYELVLIVWEDGAFKSKDRAEGNSIDFIKDQFDFIVNQINERAVKEREMRAAFLRRMNEDEDIPF